MNDLFYQRKFIGAYKYMGRWARRLELRWKVNAGGLAYFDEIMARYLDATKINFVIK